MVQKCIRVDIQSGSYRRKATDLMVKKMSLGPYLHLASSVTESAAKCCLLLLSVLFGLKLWTQTVLSVRNCSKIFSYHPSWLATKSFLKFHINNNLRKKERCWANQKYPESQLLSHKLYTNYIHLTISNAYLLFSSQRHQKVSEKKKIKCLSNVTCVYKSPHFIEEIVLTVV